MKEKSQPYPPERQIVTGRWRVSGTPRSARDCASYPTATLRSSPVFSRPTLVRASSSRPHHLICTHSTTYDPSPCPITRSTHPHTPHSTTHLTHLLNHTTTQPHNHTIIQPHNHTTPLNRTTTHTRSLVYSPAHPPGLRPAEPCTLSVVATQQLLTEILVSLMATVQKSGLDEVAGGKYNAADGTVQIKTSIKIIIKF